MSNAALQQDRTADAPRRKDLVSERYPSIAAELFNPLLSLLDRARQACGGDSDKFMILLVIAARTAQHPGFKSLCQQRLLNGEIPVLPSLSTNVRSIAASIGIPRESVRRKVAELMTTGWVVRQGHDLFITAEAYRQLGPVHEGVERLALRYFEVISGCLADPRPLHS